MNANLKKKSQMKLHAGEKNFGYSHHIKGLNILSASMESTKCSHGHPIFSKFKGAQWAVIACVFSSDFGSCS